MFILSWWIYEQQHNNTRVAQILGPGLQNTICLLSLLLLTHSTADSWLQHCSTRSAVFCLDKSTSNKYCVQRGRVDEWYCLKLQYSSSSNKCKSRKTNPLVTASATGKFMSMVPSVVQWSQFPIPHISSQLWRLLCPVSLLVTSVAAGANCYRYHHTASDGKH